MHNKIISEVVVFASPADTPEALIRASGRTPYLDSGVLERLPKSKTQTGTLVLFCSGFGPVVSGEQLAGEYKELGLGFAPIELLAYAATRKGRENYGDILSPFGDGKDYVALRAWDNRPSVRLGRNLEHWGSFWTFAGVRLAARDLGSEKAFSF